MSGPGPHEISPLGWDCAVRLSPGEGSRTRANRARRLRSVSRPRMSVKRQSGRSRVGVFGQVAWSELSCLSSLLIRSGHRSQKHGPALGHDELLLVGPGFLTFFRGNVFCRASDRGSEIVFVDDVVSIEDCTRAVARD